MKEFAKTKINGYPKVQYLVNMLNESKVSSHAATSLPGHQRELVFSDYPVEILCVFFRLIPKTSQLSAGLI